MCAGVFILISVNKYIKNLVTSAGSSNDIFNTFSGAETTLVDFMLGVTQGCCMGLFNNSNIEIPSCADGVYNNPLSVFEYCYINENTFTDGVNLGLSEETQDNYCSQKDLVLACSVDDVHEFLSVNYRYLDTYLFPAGIVLVVIGALLFMTSFLSFRAACVQIFEEDDLDDTADFSKLAVFYLNLIHGILFLLGLAVTGK